MIRVKIIPPYGSDRSALDERGWTELPEGASLRDALKAVRCSPLKAKFMLASVNGERVPINTILHDGDVVGFFCAVHRRLISLFTLIRGNDVR